MKLPPTTLRDKIEVEPLSATRWARVERAVFDAKTFASRDRAGDAPPSLTSVTSLASLRWRFAAAMLVMAGAIAAIAGGLVWRVGVPAGRSGVTRVETAANGSRVEFGESTIDVGPASAVRLAGDDAHGLVVTLDRGRVECDVAPRHERPPFLVEAGSVEVRVVGTHFVVVRDDASATHTTVSVEVQRGQVEVISGVDRVLVGAGSRWPPMPAPPSSAPAETSATTPAPPTRHDVHDGRDVGATPIAQGDVRPAAARPPPVSSPRDRYERASRLEPTQPEAALGLYSDLARQGGSWGENGLFAAGRLEAERGETDNARRLLHEYVARYPSGPNANDALHLLDRLR